MKTRIEQLREMSNEDMARFLCRLLDVAVGEFEAISGNYTSRIVCDVCPASKFCRVKHRGFIDWLNEEEEIEC